MSASGMSSLLVRLSPMYARMISNSAFLKGATYIPDKVLQEMPAGFKENPERDVVNFPHPVRLMYPPKTRLGFIPDSWFNALYDITGVTGPYILTGGLVLLILQKELLGSSHEMVVLFVRIAFFVYVGRKFGSLVARWAEAGLVEEENKQQEFLKNRLKTLHSSVAECSKKIESYKALVPMIYEAKRENIALQIEADYRQRLAVAHKNVKQRLDYMVDSAALKRKYQRKNMLDWVVNEVKKSITAQQEKAMMTQCIDRLKELSQRKNLVF
ncbi:ATP synthase subunit b, mitochondrial [Trichinella pseudospiralis]|uniref:ATP synthase subunit b n=1 Tax=Trichinella pseudospiralis TaxID=6337 RepID=A0A0V0Y4N2_TRIPS|nr:ATP synthase subunit b, mitochondrial [Trichinella pseudospiralis]KRY75372.1 ATP synthase subunit b, mitochondrial [Trichinella pseudospiralis]KRZ24347.1 ATP synthase subunit b, mitochondrial [Trichinella pseudospiralis]